MTEVKSDGTGLMYSTYLGGYGSSLAQAQAASGSAPFVGDVGCGIAIDSAGSAYVTGFTYSPSFPATDGSLQPNMNAVAHQNNASSVFVTKLSPDGSSLAYSSFLGGSGVPSTNQVVTLGDYASGIAVDVNGCAYVTGWCYSSDFPTTPGAFQPTNFNGADNVTSAFVSKVSSNGSSLIYSTNLCGHGLTGDNANAIALDSNGHAFVTGFTSSDDFGITNGAYQPQNNNPYDGNAFMTELSVDGSYEVYSTYIGGSGIYGDSGYGIAVDVNGNAYVTGYAHSTTDFAVTTGSFQTTNRAPLGGTAFVTMFNNSPTLLSVNVNPNSVIGGSSSTGTVTLAENAPQSGALIPLRSDDPGARVPASVLVAGGSNSASFEITTTPVASLKTAHISADSGGVTLSANLNLQPAQLASLNTSPSSVIGGIDCVGTVTLTGNAPKGGTNVSISSGNAAATVPANVVVVEGTNTATFTVTTAPVVASTSVTLMAAAGGNSLTTNLNIQAVQLVSLTLNPTSVPGGISTSGMVVLNGNAPTGGVSILTLSSSPGVATVLASVMVPAGSNSASFTVTTASVTSAKAVSITASYGGTVQSANLTVQPIQPASVRLNPTVVAGGVKSSGIVVLNLNAPKGGLTVTLKSNASTVASVPTSIKIPAGSNSAPFNVATVAVASSTDVTIIASSSGGSASAVLTVKPPQVLSVKLSPPSVLGGATSTVTVTLSGAAPKGGAKVFVASDSPAAATVPPSVTVPVGAKTAIFKAASHAVSASTPVSITASFVGTKATGVLTVLPPQLASMTLSPTSVKGGISSKGTVTLTGSAPTGGISVTLTSSDSTAATVSGSVVMPSGSKSAVFTITTVKASTTQKSVITANLGAVTKTATLIVNH